MCMFKLTIMRNILIINTFLALLLIFPNALDAQNAIKIRLSGNSSKFLGEPKGDETMYPLIENLMEGDTLIADWLHRGGLGLNAEVMISLTSRAWLGLELSSSKFSGENFNPPLYNFQFTGLNQLQVKVIDIEEVYPIQELRYPLDYNTSLVNLLANFRFYLLNEGRFLPFVKVHSGISFVGTELAFKNSADWPPSEYTIFIDGVAQEPENLDYGAPILFAQGTDNSAEGKKAAFNYGIGAGFEVQLNEKINLYFDYTYSAINSDLLDGRPNFNYNEETARFSRISTPGNMGKLSFGLCYKLGENLNIIGGGGSGGSKGGGGKSGRQHPYLPFYQIKRAR
jgi:opacity protein-like surface antigen